MKPEDLLEELETEYPVVYMESTETSDGDEYVYLKAEIAEENMVCIEQDNLDGTKDLVCLTIEQLEKIIKAAKDYIETK